MLLAAGAVALPPNRELVLCAPVFAEAPPPNKDFPLSALAVAVPLPKGALLLAAAVVLIKPPYGLPPLPGLAVGAPPPKVLPKLGVAVVLVLKGDGFEGFVFGCAPPKIPPVEAGPDEGVEEKADPPLNRPPGFGCWLPNRPPPEALEGAPKLKPGEDDEVLELVVGCVDPKRLGVFPVDAPNSGVDGFEGGFDMMLERCKQEYSKQGVVLHMVS